MIIRNFRINSVSLRPLFINRTIFTGTRLLDESSSDEEKDKPKRKPNKDESVKKLNDLIQMMTKKQPPTKLASQVNIPKPRETNRQKGFNLKKQKKIEAQKLEEDKLGNKLAKAATEVAESLGGDVKKTEKELLDIYFARKPESSTSEGSGALNDVLLGMKIEKGEENPQIISGMKSSSDELSEMDRASKGISRMRNEREQFSSIKGKRFEKDEIPGDASRAHQVRSVMNDDQPKQFFTQRYRSRDQVQMNLYDEQPFKYFDVDKIKSENVTPVSLPTWDHLYQRDLKQSITHPPKNIFQQLILWTEQGKVWKFPIDNEQDWIDEQQYDFSDHVFIERWLEPWCPETGPIRYFMELVCIGLSKNPYLTVNEKKAHIFWYEHYFRSKNNLLIETGVGEIKSRPAAESASA